MNNEHERRADPGDDVGRLIAQAGRRPAPAAQMQDSVRRAVEQAWNESVSQRRFRRRGLWVSAAAALGALAMGLIWLTARIQPSAPHQVAAFLAARGPVTIAGAAGDELVVAGDELPAGTTLRTGASGFVLITVGSVGVRIGPQTMLHLDRPGHVSLAGGRLYAETSGPEGAGTSLSVDTPFGRVSHLGTQFQLDLARDSLQVSVRSGHVTVTEAGGRAHTLTRGEGLDVSRDGTMRVAAVAPYGAGWDWVNALEPDFPIDGRSLAQFLVWYVRETGLKLVFVGHATAVAAGHTTLSGSIAGLTPDQALAAVMATTAFEYDKKVTGELRVRMRGAAAQGT